MELNPCTERQCMECKMEEAKEMLNRDPEEAAAFVLRHYVKD